MKTRGLLSIGLVSLVLLALEGCEHKLLSIPESEASVTFQWTDATANPSASKVPSVSVQFKPLGGGATVMATIPFKGGTVSLAPGSYSVLAVAGDLGPAESPKAAWYGRLERFEVASSGPSTCAIPMLDAFIRIQVHYTSVAHPERIASAQVSLSGVASTFDPSARAGSGIHTRLPIPVKSTAGNLFGEALAFGFCSGGDAAGSYCLTLTLLLDSGETKVVETDVNSQVLAQWGRSIVTLEVTDPVTIEEDVDITVGSGGSGTGSGDNNGGIDPLQGGEGWDVS